MRKRKIDIAIISDVHLGTYGCHADELITYLNSIEPKKLILNGDIIDIWQFRKRYFPSSHLKVLKKIIGMASKGTDVYYITGNHPLSYYFSGTRPDYNAMWKGKASTKDNEQRTEDAAIEAMRVLLICIIVC